MNRPELRSVVAVALLLALPTMSFADPAWQWQPWARFSTGYEDNPRMVFANPESVGSIALGAGGVLSALTERSSFELTPSVDLHRYEDSLYDRTDYLTVARFRHSLDEDSEFTFEASAQQDSTLTSELGTTGITYLDKQRQVVGGGASYVRQLSERDTLLVGARYSEIDYLDAEFTGLVDYDFQTSYLAWNRSVSERLTLGALATSGVSTAPQFGARDETLSAQATGSFAFTENVKAEFAIGRGELDSKGGASGSTRVYDLSLAGRGELWDWRAGAAQSYAPTGRGIQNRQLRIEGGVGRQLSENLRLSVGLSGISTDEGGDEGADVEYLRANVGGSWRFQESWFLEFNLAHAEQRRPSADATATGNMATIAIAWRSERRPPGPR